MVTMPSPATKADRQAPPIQPSVLPLQFDPHQLIADMQRAVVEIWPDSTQQQLDQVARQMRSLWGGNRPAYLGDDSQRRRRDEDIRRLHRMGERVPYLARKFDLTDRQIRRIVQADT